ncbi:MAG: CRISPR-associated endonuclease Cas3'' [Gemmatimonadota bacterium]|nr:CRISPR-associated endonuclease Cas3'' [Candidatus Poribacteria bacterium]MDE2797482.1 CRISPR-associated endonuclease Cas3'' [Gemmatimonadota bacterium]
MLLAHSPQPENDISAQLYSEHLENVIKLAVRHATELTATATDGQLFKLAVDLAAEFHDLGKLDPENQAVLSVGGSGRLPVNHVDAGVANLLKDPPQMAAQLAAILVFSHHRGLPDITEHRMRDDGSPFRDLEFDDSGRRTKDHTDKQLDEYLRMHQSVFASTRQSIDLNKQRQSDLSVLLRLALSCLIDADHFDTARNYGQAFSITSPKLEPAIRLELLDQYVAGLSENKKDERTQLRQDVYRACRDADPFSESLVACDSPVGSGKTTAIMAHLLNVAATQKLRRIFVVLPYTNIIDQSVRVYRESLVRADENPERVVAAHHHRAEFNSLATRHLTYLWNTPIVVTTAVQFFETLAACRTGALRKLHQVAGSAIFVDEAHAALPAHLWPITWKWLQDLKTDWGCYFVVGSGSLSRFWELPEFVDPLPTVPDLVDMRVRDESLDREATRVTYQSHPEPMSLKTLKPWLLQLPGPRLFIVNTVQSAAVIARHLANWKHQDNWQSNHPQVEHLSTALIPTDRAITLNRVIDRLSNDDDRDWTLVATSCVEAGVDFSFRTGIRERACLNSLLQIAGRVNRGREYEFADVWDIQLAHDSWLRPHPTFEHSSAVLGELFNERQVGVSACTEALRREIRRSRLQKDELLKAEDALNFPKVAELFRVIDSPTLTAVIDESIKEKFEYGQRVLTQDLQNGSVQIYGSRATEWALREFDRLPGLFSWELDYDPFLGFMAGVLPLVDGGADGYML